ncbi:MAG: PTS galactitol transporter subunit IIC, partial [Vallitaleaceae bacterium]|nr:PTS galactitol transporter subunit IIC [Vallitaleaceae bacterium]
MINDVLAFILSFEVYVMLPILMFALCMVVRIHIAKALKYSITLGIGFFGIFMVFDVFVAKMGPVIEAIATRTGSDMTVLDVGWPPLAAASWTFSYVPLLILLFVLMNGLMLMMKWTNIINIDIWNFWHFIFLGQIVY